MDGEPDVEESERGSDENNEKRLTTAQLLARISADISWTIVIVFTLWIMFGYCPACACEPKPCVREPLPPPRTTEEYIKDLYDRPTYVAVGVASLVMTSINCFFLMMRGMILGMEWSRKIGANSSRMYYSRRVRNEE